METPASSRVFLAYSASSLVTPSLNFLGNPSISSQASFDAKVVKALTALITAIRELLGTSLITSNHIEFGLFLHYSRRATVGRSIR
ncbi:predicted protein [Arabidopsis lyrata subsp. lyrata]|uniref:Predicted protein n=1 Tax=Arabidopsis lyrata subsp. lyrata TaxID=81972 RepID=D7LDD4_ARALL|nr:predicted protein [Arabidopsis lyrata subsp. lyrata]